MAPDTEPTLVVDEIFAAMEREEHPVVLVVMFAESLLPCDGGAGTTYETARIIEQFASRATNDAFQKSGNRIMLVECAGTVNAALKTLPGFSIVDLGLPSEAEREAAAFRWLNHRNKLYLEPGFDVKRLARLTGGMALDDLSRLRASSTEKDPLTCLLYTSPFWRIALS